MSILEKEPDLFNVSIEPQEPEDLRELAEEIVNSYDGLTVAGRFVTYKQIEFYVVNVQPNHQHEAYLQYMDLHHSNIVLGSE